MSNLIHRASKAKGLAGDASLMKWQRPCYGGNQVRRPQQVSYRHRREGDRQLAEREAQVRSRR